MFIFRDDYYNLESDKPGIAEIIIAKHRNGPTGTVELGLLRNLLNLLILKNSEPKIKNRD